MKIIVFLSLFFSLAITQISGCREEQGWTSFGTKCYKVYRTSSKFMDAALVCRAEQGDLASIHSPEENAFVTKLTRTGVVKTNHYENMVWIGLVYYEGETDWSWSDSTKIDYVNWAQGEPNALHAEFYGALMPDTSFTVNDTYNPHGGQWNNVDGVWLPAFICKRDSFIDRNTVINTV